MRPRYAAGVVELVGNIPLRIEVAIAEGREGHVGEGQTRCALKLRTSQRIVDAELIVIAHFARVRAALHEFRAGKRSAELAKQLGCVDVGPVDQGHLVVRGNNLFEGGQARRGRLVMGSARIASAQTVLGGEFVVDFDGQQAVGKPVGSGYQQVIRGSCGAAEVLLGP